MRRHTAEAKERLKIGIQLKNRRTNTYTQFPFTGKRQANEYIETQQQDRKEAQKKTISTQMFNSEVN
jgi:hypothetical protein